MIFINEQHFLQTEQLSRGCGCPQGKHRGAEDDLVGGGLRSRATGFWQERSIRQDHWCRREGTRGPAGGGEEHIQVEPVEAAPWLPSHPDDPVLTLWIIV